MSIKIMSAIFAAKFMDLKDAAGNVTKTSTAKLVLLALADHANDGGNGAYPSLTRLEGKTGLNRRTIINALDALKYNGIISLVGRSKHNTNNYTILMQALPVTVEDGAGSTPSLVTPIHQDSATGTPPLVTPVHQDGAASTPPLVTPVHLNHPLTIIKPSREDEEERTKVLTELEGLPGAVPQDISRLIDTWLEKHMPVHIRQAIRLASDKRTRSPKYVAQDGKATLPVKLRDESSHCTSDSPATLPVQPLHQSSHCTIDGPATLPSSVQPLDLNRPLTTIKPSREDEEERTKIFTKLQGLPGAFAPDTSRLIDTWLEKHPPGRVLQAIRVARDKRARSPKYIDQVLIGWEANGYPPTREQQALARAFKPAKGQNGKDPPHYKTPEYSEADLALFAGINRMSALWKAALAEARPAGIPP